MMHSIKPHETWDIHDASKIQAYMACPRAYFYRYVLGWETEEKNIHFIFGEGWHRAMEHLLINGYNSKAQAEAAQLD